MNDKQKLKIETIISGELLEHTELKHMHAYTFRDTDDNLIHIELRKIRKPDLPNYEVCTNIINCWDGYDDFREVIKHIKEYTAGTAHRFDIKC